MSEDNDMQKKSGDFLQGLVTMGIVTSGFLMIIFGANLLEHREVKLKTSDKAEIILDAETPEKGVYVSKGLQDGDSVFIGTFSDVRVGRLIQSAMIGCEFSPSGDVSVLANVMRPREGADAYELYDITGYMSDVDLCKTVSTWAPEAYLKIDSGFVSITPVANQ